MTDGLLHLVQEDGNCARTLQYQFAPSTANRIMSKIAVPNVILLHTGQWSVYQFRFRPHRLHAVHTCGLLLLMSHVAWSVCLWGEGGHTYELRKNG